MEKPIGSRFDPDARDALAPPALAALDEPRAAAECCDGGCRTRRREEPPPIHSLVAHHATSTNRSFVSRTSSSSGVCQISSLKISTSIGPR